MAGEFARVLQRVELEPLGQQREVLLHGRFVARGQRQLTEQHARGQFTERLKLDSLQNTSELACHVALPAITLPDAPPIAIELVAQAVDRLHKSILTTRGSNQQEPVTSLTFRLAHHHFQGGKIAEGKKLLESYLALQGPMWSNYGGDYPAYQRKLAMLKIAGEFARAGLKSESLEMFGRFADATTSRDYQVGGPGKEGAALLNSLASLEPSERYDLLKAWSMPTKDRLSVRFIASLVAGDKAPAAFDAARGATPRAARQTQFLGTADLLVAAAAATGKVNELQRELEPHAAKNVENAKFLLLLTRLAQADDTKIASDLLADIEVQRKADTEAAKNTSNRGRQRPDLSNAILAQAAVARESTRDAGLALTTFQFTRWSTFQDHLHMAAMRHLYNATVVGEFRAAQLDIAPHDVGLAHWTGGAFAPASYITGGSVPSWWLAHDGMIQHICGPDQSYLFLNYPLAGTFEFSCEAWLGGWAEGNAGYGGLIFDALNLGAATRIYPIGNRGNSLNKPDPMERSEHFNRITIRVEPGRVQHLVNNVLIHDEKTTGASTSPWLLLQCDRVWQTAYRDLRITGTPEIPREVKLTDGSSLLGWSAGFYAENQAPHFKTANENTDDDYSDSRNSRPVAELDWWAFDGEIHGRRVSSSGLAKPPVMQSRLHYCRPLRSGDTLRYEFWYEPGAAETHVHPALDRLAMILEPEGVKLHWMTESNEGLSTGGLLNDNLLDDPAGRRGEGPLPLKERDWNRVTLALRGDVVTVSLNDKTVYERTLEPDNDRQFGLYHDKHTTAARVRNVVLTGEWPKSLTPDMLANLTAPVRQPTADERRRLAKAFEDKYAAGSIDQVLVRTRALPPAERYDALRGWVLPNDDHAAFRLYGSTAPVNPGRATVLVTGHGAKAEEKTPHPLPAKPGRGDKVGEDQQEAVKTKSTRTLVGGELIAPMIDLVEVAQQLNKLDELAEAIRTLPEDLPNSVRLRIASLVLVDLARSDFASAEAGLKQLLPIVISLGDEAQVERERWPELLVAWKAIEHRETRPAAQALLSVLWDRQNRKGIAGNWDAQVRAAFYQGQALADSDARIESVTSVTSPQGQWSQATLAKADSLGIGPAPRYVFQGSEVSHIAGRGHDRVLFQSPLRGSFTVEADLSTFGYRETRLMLGGIWAIPRYDLSAADIGNTMTSWSGPAFTPKMELLGDWYRAKLVVEPGKATFFANDRVLLEQPLDENADPWLGLHVFGNYGGGSRSVRITGTPVIPDSLKLSAGPELLASGWWPGYYDESYNGDDATWKKLGEEITANKLDAQAGRSRESLLHYHRPLLEDGELSYEFFHLAGQTHVHPALGRLAFLIEPDGVKLHIVTDAQYDRSGLAPDNVTVEQTHRRGPATLPLKSGEWNKLSLTMTGDTLGLSLNGVAIYERSVEPNNSRLFGLFRYSGETDVRVKNVIYRGNWPMTLPSVKEQELAGKDLELATFRPGELPATWAWNFQGKRPGHLNESGVTATTKRTPVEGGLSIVREPSADRASESAGFQWSHVSIGGDFEVTLGYRDFQSVTKSETHQVPRMEIVLAIGGGFASPPHSHTLALTHRRMHDNTMQLTSISGVRRNPPAEEWQASDRQLVATSGRIRIVRRGGTAYCLYGKPGTDEWEVLDYRPVSTADVKDLLIGLRTEDLAANASTVLTEFSVRAKRLDYEPRFANGDPSSTVAWNFKGAQPPLLITSGVSETSRAERTDAGMKLVRELKTVPPTIGYEMRDVSIKGDFAATLDYDQFESKIKATGDDGAVPRVEMMLAVGGRLDQPHSHIVSFMHRRNHDGSNVNYAFVGTKPKQGDYAWAASNLATTGSSGRLRVVRQGSNITFQRADAGSTDWKQVGHHPVGAGDVKHLVVGINAQDQDASASVVFTNFTLEATGLSTPAEATFDEKALPARLVWNFQGIVPPPFLKPNKVTPPNLSEPTDTGLKLTRAANAVKGNDQVSLQWNGLIQGDFEVTADYRDYQSKSIGTDWKVPRIELASYLYPVGGKDHSHVFAVFHERKANSEAIQGQVGTRGADNQFTWTSDIFTQERSTGRLRLARKGKRVFQLTAPADSNDWTLVGFNDLDNEDLRQLILSVRSDDLTADVTATLTNLTIRADKIEGVK